MQPRMALGLLVACGAMAAGGGTRAAGTEDLPNPLEPLLANTDSLELTERIRSEYVCLLGLDVEKACSAARFFGGLGAKLVLVEALDSKFYEVRTCAASALGRMRPKDDIALTQTLADKLRGLQTLFTGGAEVQMLRSRYQQALIETLATTTDMDLVHVEKNRGAGAVVTAVMDWLDQKRSVPAGAAKIQASDGSSHNEADAAPRMPATEQEANKGPSVGAATLSAIEGALSSTADTAATPARIPPMRSSNGFGWVHVAIAFSVGFVAGAAGVWMLLHRRGTI